MSQPKLMRRDWTRIFFLHLAKCGGTTLVELISKNFSRDRILMGDDVHRLRDRFHGEDKNYATLLGHILKSYDAVLGHPNLDRVLSDEFVYVTMLRDPFSRLLSKYN